MRVGTLAAGRIRHSAALPFAPPRPRRSGLWPARGNPPSKPLSQASGMTHRGIARCSLPTCHFSPGTSYAIAEAPCANTKRMRGAVRRSGLQPKRNRSLRNRSDFATPILVLPDALLEEGCANEMTWNEPKSSAIQIDAPKKRPFVIKWCLPYRINRPAARQDGRKAPRLLNDLPNLARDLSHFFHSVAGVADALTARKTRWLGRGQRPLS